MPPDCKADPVFHVSLLKKAVAEIAQVQPLPSVLAENFELAVQPEDILAVRGNTAQEQEVVVKWQQLHEFENS